MHEDALPPGELAELRARLAEAEDTLRAIRAGEVDAIIVEDGTGEKVYALRSADHPYRVLVEQLREGAAILTTAGDILYSNRRFAELVGAPLEDVIGSSVVRFVSPPERDTFDARLARGHGGWTGTLLDAQGRVRSVYLSLTASVNEGVEQRNLIAADLTELIDARAARERAERENQAKDEFVAMLAHELRNPLGAIAGAIQVLDIVGNPAGPAVQARAIISRQVQQLSRLISDLLDAARVAMGKVTLHRAPVNWTEIVTRCLAGVAVGEGNARRFETDLRPLWIDGDPVRVQQVVENLLDNAVKYTAPGGRIEVSLRERNGRGVLTVVDDGAGIPADLLPRVFDLFVQGQQTIDRARGGLGIGLTVVRRVVELHGGEVDVASEGPGKGTRFTVSLPAVPAPRDTAAAASDHDGRPRRVLIVEDNPDTRQMYRMVLELAGHTVLEASDGAEGLEVLRKERPDVALVDIGLPVLDGYELARRFRGDDPAGRTVLVALTGYGAADDVERARAAGFERHLVKPVTGEVLDEAVRSDPGARHAGPA